MLLSLFLLLVPITGLSCRTAAGKHLDRVKGAREHVVAFVFLRFSRVECVDVAPALFSFPCSIPHLHFFSSSLLPLYLVSSLPLFL
jgi:hypothetical protein